MTHDVLALAHELSRKEEPFALATVVRCERPTSAKPGAKALIRGDGTVLGWIGGSCAEPVVVKEGLRALRDGRPRFIALVGDGGVGPRTREGVLEFAMTCHSGGTLEIFVEPVLPTPQIVLVGRGPVTEALEALSKAMGFSVTVVAAEAQADLPLRLPVTQRTFVVVATHGAFDEEALEQALRSDARYVSLVASRKRAGVVADALRARGMPADRLDRLKAPAGLDIGAVTPDEIAVSILAEILLASRRQAGAETGGGRDTAGEHEATDPVCGMSVEVATARYRSEAFGRSFYFCCSRCKRTFDADPAPYAGSAAGRTSV